MLNVSRSNIKLLAYKTYSYDFGIACLGGVATSLSIEPVSFFLLAWIGLAALWFLILKNQKGNTIKKIFLLGLFWGYAYHGITLSWIFNFHPLTWMGISWISSLFFAITYWLIISSLGALFVAVWACSLKFVVSRKYNLLTQIITGTALWCGLECLYRQSPFWWTSLSLSQSPHNLWILQLNQISGSETSVAVIVFVNGMLANLLWSSRQKYSSHYRGKLIKKTLYIFLVAHLFGAFLYYVTFSEGESISIGIIQGNIPHEIKFKQQGLDLANIQYLEGYKSLSSKGVDAVLTPELALPYFGSYPFLEKELLLQSVKLRKTPFWIGTRTDDFKNNKNKKLSLISLEESGITSQYDKIKLILFGEYIPFEGTRFEPLVRKFFPFGVNHLPGEKEQIFDTPFGKAIVGICYESAFSQIFLRQARAGGKFIIVTTADGLFGESMMRQHHAQDVVRAIETKRWLVRANSRNYSGVINHRGDTVWLIDSQGYRTKTAKINLSDFQTIYTRFGNWLTPALLLLSILLLIFNHRKNSFSL